MTFDSLPTGFCPAKPIPADLEEFTQISTKRPVTLQRKYDGHRVLLVNGPNKANVYSRRLEVLTHHFPAQVMALRQMLAGTVLDAEYVVPPREGETSFTLAASICRSNPTTGRRLHADYGGQFVVFDLLYLKEEPVWRLSYAQRQELLSEVLHHWPLPALRRPEVIGSTPAGVAKCEDTGQADLWEGLIAWVNDAPTYVSVNGSLKRCGCYKWKPVREDDFIAVGYEPGEGACAGAVGALHLAQVDNRGLPISCGKVGSGFDAKTRLVAKHWSYPTVVQIKYASRTADGRLRFPVFVRHRPDKPLHECQLSCPQSNLPALTPKAR